MEVGGELTMGFSESHEVNPHREMEEGRKAGRRRKQQGEERSEEK